MEIENKLGLGIIITSLSFWIFYAVWEAYIL